MPFNRSLIRSGIQTLFLLLIFLPGPGQSGLFAARLSADQVIRRWELDDVQLSPDGTLVAFSVEAPIQGRGRNYDVWVYDLKRSSLRQITDWKGADSRPRWSSRWKDAGLSLQPLRRQEAVRRSGRGGTGALSHRVGGWSVLLRLVSRGRKNRLCGARSGPREGSPGGR